MKSITIHGLDAPLLSLLESRAKSDGLSMNKTVKKLLEEALGIRPKEMLKRRKDFQEFLGLWSAAEQSSFRKATEDFEKAAKEDWQ